MTRDVLLAIDQGTTNTKAVLVDHSGSIVAATSAPVTSSYPRSDWAEQSADDIWTSVCAVIEEIVGRAEAGSLRIVGLAITNQRETLIAFDRATGCPIGPAILWQCRRSADRCNRLRHEGVEATVIAATGLGLNPLFPATKLAWLLAEHPEARRLAEAGRLAAGTVDAWLLYKLTGGRRFATDHSNASRTQLFDIRQLAWSTELAGIFGVPPAVLPEALPSDARFGETAEGATALPAGLPIHAMMGDSHAALFGHGVRAAGTVKATYGTGSSLMTLTAAPLVSRHGLSGTIAWTRDGETAYALEGNISVSAQSAAFVAQLLGLGSVTALSDLAASVAGSEGVVFVPALAGLGAPHWDDRATGLVNGMTLSTKPAHLARATFEAITLQIHDVFTAMEKDVGTELDRLLADGGASANGFLMQLQADVLNRRVDRSERPEVGALGVAMMAARPLGFAIPEHVAGRATHQPRMNSGERGELLRRWQSAIEKTKMN